MSAVRSQIEQHLADVHVNILRKDINRVVRIILSEISEALCSNAYNACEFRNFGRFSTKIQKARISRNPATGAPVNCIQKRVLKWKASKVLLKRLNAK